MPGLTHPQPAGRPARPEGQNDRLRLRRETNKCSDSPAKRSPRARRPVERLDPFRRPTPNGRLGAVQFRRRLVGATMLDLRFDVRIRAHFTRPLRLMIGTSFLESSSYWNTMRRKICCMLILHNKTPFRHLHCERFNKKAPCSKVTKAPWKLTIL